MRMLMTANQNVVLMDEEEEDEEEDINEESVGEGQRSILDFFGRRRRRSERGEGQCLRGSGLWCSEARHSSVATLIGGSARHLLQDCATPWYVACTR